MVTTRPIEEKDLDTLQTALDGNHFHPDQTIGQYVGPKKYTEVYEDEEGIVGFLRHTKSLRMVATWTDYNAVRRNAASIARGIERSIEIAKQNGFTEIIFESQVPEMIEFCKRFGFKEIKGEFVKFV